VFGNGRICGQQGEENIAKKAFRQKGTLKMGK
jgi:hypothetical protein